MDNYLNKKAWPPYVAGIVVGLLQIPAFLLIKTALGVSSSYVSVAGYVASVFDKSILTHSYFQKYITSPVYAWQGSLLAGVVIGAFISKKLSGAKRKSHSPIWQKTLGIKTLRWRCVMAFIGGFVLLFGARWAGGCTTGHGLSGVSQFAVGSLIMAAMMFLGGIIVSAFYRKL